MPFFSFLRFGIPLLFLFAIDGFFLYDFLLVFFQVRFDVFGNFGQVHELAFDLRIEFVQLIDFYISFVDEHLGAESSAWVPAFDGRSETASVAISRVDWGSDGSLALALLVRHLI